MTQPASKRLVTEADISDPTSAAGAALATSIAGTIEQLPAASGTDDTTVINAALNRVRLAGGGIVRGAPGSDYLTSTPLVIGSRTTLDMTGSSVTLLPSSGCHVLRNYAYSAASTVMDAAVSVTGSVVKVTAPTAAFNSGSVGKAILVWRAAPDGRNLATTITSVTSGVATVAATAARVMANTQATIGPRDVEVKVRGGVWDRGTNNGTAPTFGNTMHFRRLDDLEVFDLKVKSQAGKYSICPADVTDFKVHDIDFDVTSDGVHVNGPATGGTIGNLRGTTLDDTVSLTPNDWVIGNDTYGDITDVFIDNLDSLTDNTVLKILGGSDALGGYFATAARRITARNIGGRTTSISENVPAGVCLGNDPGEPGTNGGTLEDIVVQNITTQVPDGTVLIYINPLTARRITVDGFRADSTTNTVAPVYVAPTTSGTLSVVKILNARCGSLGIDGLVHVTASATIGRLIVKDADIESWNGGDTRGLVVNEGAIGTLKVRGLDLAGGTGGNVVALNGPAQHTMLDGITMTSSSIACALVWVNTSSPCPDVLVSNVTADNVGGTVGLMLYHATASVSRASFENLHLKPGRLAISYASGQTMSAIHANNVTLTGSPQALGQCNTTTIYTLSNITATDCSSIMYVQGSADVLFRGGSGLYFNAQTFGLETTTHHLRCQSPMFPCDVSKLNYNDVGDMAFNINSALGCGVGPVGRNGSTWVNLTTGAAA